MLNSLRKIARMDEFIKKYEIHRRQQQKNQQNQLESMKS